MRVIFASALYSHQFPMFLTHQEKKSSEKENGRVLISSFVVDSGPSCSDSKVIWPITVVSVSCANEDAISDSD